MPIKTVEGIGWLKTINNNFENLAEAEGLIATISVGLEATDIINVEVQLVYRGSGADIDHVEACHVYLSDDSAGGDLISTAPSGGWAIGTKGVLISQITNKMALVMCAADGIFDIDIEESGTKTLYMVVIAPDGNVYVSSAIIFAIVS